MRTEIKISRIQIDRRRLVDFTVHVWEGEYARAVETDLDGSETTVVRFVRKGRPRVLRGTFQAEARATTQEIEALTPRRLTARLERENADMVPHQGGRPLEETEIDDAPAGRI